VSAQLCPSFPTLRSSDLTFFWRERTYISCWNSFPTENAGLWRIYGDDKGLAIKTSWKKMKDSLINGDCVDRVFYGRVDYKNFSTEGVNSGTYTDQYFSKRIEFSHENEFRLVAHDASKDHNYNDEDLTRSEERREGKEGTEQ